MKILTTTFSMIIFFFGATIASAESFGYIDTHGDLRVVEAENATLAIETAENIAFDSGVMVMSADSLVIFERLGLASYASAHTTE